MVATGEELDPVHEPVHQRHAHAALAALADVVAQIGTLVRAGQEDGIAVVGNFYVQVVLVESQLQQLRKVAGCSDSSAQSRAPAGGGGANRQRGGRTSFGGMN